LVVSRTRIARWATAASRLFRIGEEGEPATPSTILSRAAARLGLRRSRRLVSAPIPWKPRGGPSPDSTFTRVRAERLSLGVAARVPQNPPRIFVRPTADGCREASLASPLDNLQPFDRRKAVMTAFPRAPPGAPFSDSHSEWESPPCSGTRPPRPPRPPPRLRPGRRSVVVSASRDGTAEGEVPGLPS
jgi:hypothetical protein